jgi:hypothetical protein
MNYFSDVADTKVSEGSGSVKRKYTNQIPGDFVIRVDRCKLFKKDKGRGVAVICVEGKIVDHSDSNYIGTDIQEMANQSMQQEKFFNELAKRMGAVDLLLNGKTEGYEVNAGVSGDDWNEAITNVFGSSLKGILIQYNNTAMKDKETGEVIEGKYWANMLGPVLPGQLEIDPNTIDGIHPAYLG